MEPIGIPARPIHDPVQVSESNSSKAAEAASQFEALLIASMLKASREGGASWLGTRDDAAAASAIGFAEEHLSHVLAAQGGLGIARMVTAALNNQNRPYAAGTDAGSGDATTAAGNSGPEV